MSEFEIKDYTAIGRERVTEQFVEKPVFAKYLDLVQSEAIAVQNVISDCYSLRSIDTAFGEQLDVIGRIVGQPRDLFDSVIIYYFGFQGASGALSFGTRSNPTTGGIFKSRNDPLRGARYLNDEEYKALIKIKILKNSTQGVIDDFLQMIQLLYNVTSVTFTELPGVITINIGRSYNDPALSYFKGLDEIELGRTYLPLPIGIRLEFDGTIL